MIGILAVCLGDIVGIRMFFWMGLNFFLTRIQIGAIAPMAGELRIGADFFYS